eukprot:3696568-Amphidinium_carterae.1
MSLDSSFSTTCVWAIDRLMPSLSMKERIVERIMNNSVAARVSDFEAANAARAQARCVLSRAMYPTGLAESTYNWYSMAFVCKLA